jgi:hypothetical protein
LDLGWTNISFVKLGDKDRFMCLNLCWIPGIKYVVGISLVVSYIGSKFEEVLVTFGQINILSLFFITELCLYPVYIMLMKRLEIPN